MYNTHSPTEWAAIGSAAIGVYAASACHELAPGAVYARAVVGCAAVRVRRAPLQAAVSAAVLLALLLPTSPAGGTR